MTTIANPLTIINRPNQQVGWRSAYRGQGWAIYLRFLAIAGAGAVNLCVGPVWLGELHHTGPGEGPPEGRSARPVENLMRNSGYSLQAPQDGSADSKARITWRSAPWITSVADSYSPAPPPLQ
jgi:hypothetical protein